MTNQTNTFAFRLASSQPKSSGWTVRPGVTAPGCTKTNDEFDNYAEDYDVWGIYRGRDKGQLC